MSFYESQEWRRLRYRVLRNFGFKCQACGASGGKTKIHVDHIKPRSKYPNLELEESNLQVLCENCNFGKSNEFEDNLVPLLEEKEKKELKCIRREQEMLVRADCPIKDENLKEKLRLDHKKRLMTLELKEKSRLLVRELCNGPAIDASEALEKIMGLYRARRTDNRRRGDE